MKILLIHSGHTFATLEVGLGYEAGLAACGVEVIPWRLDKVQIFLHSLRDAGERQGLIPPEQRQHITDLVTNISSADAVTLALMHDVDAVVVVYGLLFPPARVAALKQLGIPVVCIGTEAPYLRKELEVAANYTHWFTNERRAVGAFQDAGANAFYLPTAYDPTKHQPGPADPAKAVDLVFIGGFYAERKRMLESAPWGDIATYFGGTLDKSDNPFQGVIPNEETAAWYRSAKLSLNIHRTTGDFWAGEQIDPSLAESLGPRAYEVPACGGFLLSDPRPELFDVFGDAAATFKAGDPDDLARQARYWLTHPDRYEAAKQAQHEAIHPHSYTNRARKLLEIVV